MNSQKSPLNYEEINDRQTTHIPSGQFGLELYLKLINDKQSCVCLVNQRTWRASEGSHASYGLRLSRRRRRRGPMRDPRGAPTTCCSSDVPARAHKELVWAPKVDKGSLGCSLGWPKRIGRHRQKGPTCWAPRSAQKHSHTKVEREMH